MTKSIAQTLTESREFHTDDAITPQLICDAIRAMPSASLSDLRQIVKACRDAFPTFDGYDLDLD